MVLEKKYIIEELLKNDIKITGTLHIGAHECEEIPFYTNLGLKLKDMIWIEANPDKVNEAKQRNIPNVYEAVVTNEDNKEIEFHVANNFQSSSVLELGTHKQDHPDIKYVSSFMAKTITIKTFFKKHNILNPEKYNFWNFDIQGAELMALQGAEELINNVKAINLEVNTKEVYKGCPLIGDIDNYLSKFGFRRQLTKITPQGWGDALYIKQKKQIYIYNSSDFGNKVFTLIYGVYLYNLYKGECKINYVINKSKYTKTNIQYNKYDNYNYIDNDNNYINNDNYIDNDNDTENFDKNLDIIFPESQNKINFIKYNDLSHYNKVIINKILRSNNKIYEKTNQLPNYEDLDIDTFFYDCYQLIYEMYSTFNEEDKHIFYKFNENIITDNRVFNIKQLDYIILDIRYGNKLNITKDNINDNKENINEYIMCSPEYYYNMMHKYCNFQKDIYYLVIITDSPDIIKHYIANKYQNKNNFIIFNSEWFNTFFLFYYAKVIILSNSTLSLAGALFNKDSTNILLVDDDFINNKNRSPELQNLPDKWIINHNKQYILNYNRDLILEMSKYNIYFKRHMSYQNTLIYKQNLKSVSNIQYNYKHNIFISSSDYLFSKTIKTLYEAKKFPQNNFSINNIVFGVELVFNKILNDNNIKECVFITKDRWRPASIQRLFQFSNIKVHKIYINRVSYNIIYDYNIIYNYINNDSLIFYDIKDGYGVEFDFHYDKFMLKINEYLLKIKNLKLCILVFTPNLILPFTLNTFINIANHCEKYEFIYTHSGILIVYHNIKNYNINLSNLKHKFNRLMHTIAYSSSEDIMNEIINAQQSLKSIASTYFIKFNDKIQSQNIKYNIEIIDLDYKVTNDNFVKNLLEYIYIEFDKLNYYLKLYTIKNFKNEILFKDYYTKRNNIWYTFVNEDTKYSNIKQDLKELKKTFTFKNNKKLTKKQVININNSYKALSKKLSHKLSIKLSKKLSKKLSTQIYNKSKNSNSLL